jgi:TonB family protein
MLPLGTKSLPQIKEYKDPTDRVVNLATLLEHVLRSISPEKDVDTGKDLTFEQLLKLHEHKFSDYEAADDTRWVRNQLAHATGKATLQKVLRAEPRLIQAVLDIVLRDECPPDIRRAAKGESFDASAEQAAGPAAARHTRPSWLRQGPVPPPPRTRPPISSPQRFVALPASPFAIKRKQRRRLMRGGIALAALGFTIFLSTEALQLAHNLTGQNTPEIRHVAEGGGCTRCVDLIAYCYAHGYTGVSNRDNTAIGWRCQPNNIKVDVDQACRDRYGPSYYSVLTSPSPGGQNDWDCRTPQQTAVTAPPAVPADTPTLPPPQPDDQNQIGLPPALGGLPAGVPSASLPQIASDGVTPAGMKVYELDGTMTRPVVVSKSEPLYTEDARAKKITGTVILKFILTADGRPTAFQVVQSVDPGLDRSAIECVQSWRWKPALKDNVPVAVWGKVEVNFILL